MDKQEAKRKWRGPFFKLPGIRSKLLLSYLAAILIPMLTLGVYSLKLLDSSLKEQSASMEKQDLLQLAENSKYFLNSFVSMSSDICFDPKIWQYFNTSYSYPNLSTEGYYNLIRPIFTRYLTLRPEISKITVFTKNETMLYNNFEIAPVVPGTYEDKLYKETLSERKIRWTLYEDPVSRKKSILLTRMLNLNNVNVGMLAVYIDESQLYNGIHGEGEDSDTYVIAPDGVVLSSTDRETIGTNIAGTDLDVRLKPDGDILIKEVKGEQGTDRLAGLTLSLEQEPKELWSIVKTVPMKSVLAVAYPSRLYQIGAFVLLLLLLCLISLAMSDSITRRIKALVVSMRKVERGDFDVAVKLEGNDEISYMGSAFNRMAAKLDELVRQVYEMQLNQKDMELKNRETQLKMLQSQINPHFLFNTLDAVLYGIRNDKEETAKIVEFLAGSFRRSIQWKEELIPIAEEVGFIEEYLTIQKFRMPDKFAWHTEVSEEAQAHKLPKMLIQPLVENAVHHGLSLKKDSGVLRLTIRTEGEWILITVSDNGIGMEEWRLEEVLETLQNSDIRGMESHIGLKNVYDRIRLYYGTEGSLHLSSEAGKGTAVEIRIPR
ncbi:sensor histidine kinase [Paenibacillus sp. M1]|uniref:histidine kinase n=1 Tax=Paenibacillus haidiansis TaxID=1574488 RepID=A0ABU7VRG6_9BACL